MKKLNILLVDDDEVYLFVTKHILKKLDTELSVLSYTDGEQAHDFLVNIKHQPEKLPDLVLLDINMPFMDGWEFLKEFKKFKTEINHSIYIYLVTSSARENDQKRAQEIEEVTGYILKPISQEKLKDILARVYGDF